MSIENGKSWISKIKEWLEIHGHSLEMRVAKKFGENEFNVSQFEYFVDQETKSVRQMDVVASISRMIDNSVVTVNLIIECKYAKSKPWVILLTQKKLDKFTFFLRQLQGRHPSDWKKIPTLQGRLVGSVLLALDKLLDIDKFSVEPAGYTVQEARFDSNYRPDPNQQDYAFEAVVQVSKSIESRDKQHEMIFTNTAREYENGIDTGFRRLGAHTESLSLYLSIDIPVVLVSGFPFESHLSDNYDITVNEISDGFVLTPYKLLEERGNMTITLSPVMIITESNLDTFIPRIREMMENILKQESAIHDVIQYEESKLKPKSDINF